MCSFFTANIIFSIHFHVTHRQQFRQYNVSTNAFLKYNHRKFVEYYQKVQ